MNEPQEGRMKLDISALLREQVITMQCRLGDLPKGVRDHPDVKNAIRQLSRTRAALEKLLP